MITFMLLESNNAMSTPKRVEVAMEPLRIFEATFLLYALEFGITAMRESKDNNADAIIFAEKYFAALSYLVDTAWNVENQVQILLDTLKAASYGATS